MANASVPQGISPLEAMRKLGENEVAPLSPNEFVQEAGLSPLQAMAMLGAQLSAPTRQVKRKKPLGFSSKEYARRKKKSRMAKASKKHNRKK